MAKIIEGSIVLIKRERSPINQYIPKDANCVGVIKEIDSANTNPNYVVFNNGKCSISLADNDFSLLSVARPGSIVQAKIDGAVVPFYLTGAVGFEPVNPRGKYPENPETPWLELLSLDGKKKISLPIQHVDVANATSPKEAGTALLIGKARAFGAVIERAEDGWFNFFTHPDNTAFGHPLRQCKGEYETRGRAWTACSLNLLERGLIVPNYYKKAPVGHANTEVPLFSNTPAEDSEFIKSSLKA